MTLLPKVKRSAYQKLRQDQLLVFATAVVTSTVDIPEYAAVNDQAKDVQTKTDAYLVALEAAKTRDSKKIIEKNLAKAELIASMNTLSNHLNCNATDVAYITNSGMVAQSTPSSSTTKDAPVRPTNVVVSPTLTRGVVAVAFDLENEDNFLAAAGEWSLDQENWNNGTYLDKRKGEIAGLPSFSTVFVRLRSIGRNDLKSAWTDVVAVPVL